MKSFRVLIGKLNCYDIARAVASLEGAAYASLDEAIYSSLGGRKKCLSPVQMSVGGLLHHKVNSVPVTLRYHGLARLPR